jgi:hypothetical protein
VSVLLMECISHKIKHFGHNRKCVCVRNLPNLNGDPEGKRGNLLTTVISECFIRQYTYFILMGAGIKNQ